MSEATAGERRCRPGCKPGGACRWIGCKNAEPDAGDASEEAHRRFLTEPVVRPGCRQCGPGYRLDDEGCRHGAGDASEPLSDHEYGGLPWDGNEPKMRAALNALVASREAAAATRARAEALREAQAWAAAGVTVVDIREVLALLAADTVGEDTP